MEKDFSKWHDFKSKLQKIDKRFYFQERGIWLCSVGLNLGHEEDGKRDQFLRPVIVFKKFDDDTFWGIPLTSQVHGGVRYFQFLFGNRIAVAMLSQMRLFDRKRFIRRIGEMSNSEFDRLKSQLRNMMQ